MSISRCRKRAFPFGIYGRSRPGRTASSTAVPCVLLTRKGSQVQTLSRPPHRTAGQAGSQDPASCFRHLTPAHRAATGQQPGTNRRLTVRQDDDAEGSQRPPSEGRRSHSQEWGDTNSRRPLGGLPGGSYAGSLTYVLSPRGRPLMPLHSSSPTCRFDVYPPSTGGLRSRPVPDASVLRDQGPIGR